MNSLDMREWLLASEIISSAPCSVELPAGTGKTHLIASIALYSKNLGKRTLILTHTNAGVAAIKSRLDKFGVTPFSTKVATICSWSEKLVFAYPILSEMDEGLTHGDEQYYSACVSCAIRLCAHDAIASVIADSYSLILIDEYQDCDIFQHHLAIALKNIVGNVVVFGDRLQRIFDFGKVPFPDWDSDICASFTSFCGIVPKPHRWEQSNPDLGRWLIEEVRPALLSGGRPDYSVSIMGLVHRSPIEGIKDKDGEIIKACYRLKSKSNSASVLCPNLPPSRSLKLAKRLSGKFAFREEMEGRFARKSLEQYTQCSNSHERASWLASFAKECFSSLSKVLDDPVVNALSKGRSIDRLKGANARSGHSSLLDALDVAATDFNSSTFSSVVDLLFEYCGSHIVRSTAWNEVVHAVTSHLLTGFSPLAELEAIRSGISIPRTQSHFVSRVLLVKGLEFDDVIVVDASKADAYSKENLYVALTRPKCTLTVFD